jgi:Glu-tRNA(Gln) amidotransferase subunit E-like FAD-binding protein
MIGQALPNQAAEAAAAFGSIMMSTFESRRSLAAIR